jgi:hypothetical protein
VRHRDLQANEDEAESSIERNGSECAQAAKVFDPRVSPPLHCERRDADCESQRDGRATVKQAHGAEHEYGRRRDRDLRHLKLLSGNSAELAGVKPPTGADASPSPCA